MEAERETSRWRGAWSPFSKVGWWSWEAVVGLEAADLRFWVRAEVGILIAKEGQRV